MHKWSPCHREVLKRSHVDKTILLLQIGNRYVPIVETAVKMVDLEAEAAEAEAAAAMSNETNEKDQEASPVLNNEESENNGENSAGQTADPLNATSGPQSLNLPSHRRQSSENNQENKSLTEESFPLQPL